MVAVKTDSSNKSDVQTAKTATSSELKKEKTRRSILSNAQKLFAKNGYDATNISDIAKKCGVAHGTVYYHFKDKASILQELAADFADKIKEMSAKWATTTEVDEQVNKKFARDVTLLFIENKDLARIVMKESYYTDRNIRKMINDTYEFLYEQTGRALELGIALGSVRPMNTRVAAVAMVGMIREVIMNYIDKKDKTDIEEIVEELAALQFFGIRPDGGK